MPDGEGPPVWTREDGTEVPAVYAHVTHSRFGEHLSEGEQIAVIFHDRAVIAEVTEVVTDDE